MGVVCRAPADRADGEHREPVAGPRHDAEVDDPAVADRHELVRGLAFPVRVMTEREVAASLLNEGVEPVDS